MGLTDWHLAVKVTVNGEDVTTAFNQRLISMTLTDTAGIQADSVDMVLADYAPLKPIALPATGAEISIALGYGYSAQVMGLYVVEEVEVGGPPGNVRIRGYSSSFGGTDKGKTALSHAAGPRIRPWAPW